MIGMGFHEFLVLLILSFIASKQLTTCYSTVTSNVSMASCQSGWRSASGLGSDNHAGPLVFRVPRPGWLRHSI